MIDSPIDPWEHGFGKLRYSQFESKNISETTMGPSINYVITSEGGGGCEMMMDDDGRGGRGLQYDDVITLFLGICLKWEIFF